MATQDSHIGVVDNLNGNNKSPQVTAKKVRDLLNEGVALDDSVQSCVQENVEEARNGQAPCEAVSKEAFFSRVETYTCMKWAGKPQALSPLQCARYGWVNVDSEMLRCSSCQAFLCASLHPTQDIGKYEERLSEITTQLQTKHEKFCFWPDSPCPGRFWEIPVGEPSLLVSAYLERYKSLCLLDQQLPAMKPEDLKLMSVTEESIGMLLQLLEDELKKDSVSSDKIMVEPLSVQVAACIGALCGWSASPSMSSLHLPVLVCSLCQRKVGLWSFQQVESTAGDVDSTFDSPSARVCDRGTPNMPIVSTPCRMKLRSQDTARSDLSDGTPSPVIGRTRSRDTPSPSEDLPSPLLRGKRPMTRSRGQGDTCEVPSSPQRKAKRTRLFSVGSSDTPVHRGLFDPLAQHRSWCPWLGLVNKNAEEEMQLADPLHLLPDSECPLQAWRASFQILLSMKKCASPTEAPAQSLLDKSKRVFKIFRQWQTTSQLN